MPTLELSEPQRKLLSQRKAALLERARRACEYLHSLGSTEVYLFGSITREDFHPHSDVDIAVSGLPYKHIYSVESKVGDILGTDDFDLVYLEHAKGRLRDRVQAKGLRIC